MKCDSKENRFLVDGVCKCMDGFIDLENKC